MSAEQAARQNIDKPTSRQADEHDAYAAARWMIDMDARGVLAGYFAPPLTDLERATAEREGWILGLM